MKCPHCNGIFPFVQCPECGSETPEGSLYCCQCGNKINLEKEEIDPLERIPCNDGNCIGTINEKGLCSICGKTYTKEPL